MSEKAKKYIVMDLRLVIKPSINGLPSMSNLIENIKSVKVLRVTEATKLKKVSIDFIETINLDHVRS